MASGLPNVCVDIPSGRNLLRKETGMFFAANDRDAAVAAVRRLALFLDLRASMGRAARAASAAYDWDTASAMVLDAYRALLGADTVSTTADPGAAPAPWRNRSAAG
jgi:phosphatidylinositol alpha 1,6-mannosyltransferase